MIQNRFRELLARKERLERRTITRRDVAAETGISLSSVQNWASNSVKRFDSVQIEAFCKYFDCTVGELIVFEDELSGQLIEAVLA